MVTKFKFLNSNPYYVGAGGSQPILGAHMVDGGGVPATASRLAVIIVFSEHLGFQAKCSIRRASPCERSSRWVSGEVDESASYTIAQQ